MNADLAFYSGRLTEIKDRIRQAQIRAVFSANMEMILMYWDIGRIIGLGHKMGQNWSGKIIRNNETHEIHENFN